MQLERLYDMKHYTGKKCEFDGYTFDSIPEKDYYIELKQNLRVDKLTVHPSFILLDGFRNNEGKSVRSIKFKPDFMYILNGIKYIVDIKPLNKKLIETDFTLRWKLLQSMYRDEDIRFRLIAWDSKLRKFVEI